MRPLHMLMMLGVCTLWAGNMIAIKESVDAIPPLLAVALRYALILPVCLPFLAVLRPAPGESGPGRMRYALGAALFLALSFGLGAVSFWLATNISALAIAGQLGVPFSLLLAIAFAGERIQWRRTLGIVMAFAGVAVLVFDPRVFDERWALLLTVLAAFTWAVSTMLLRNLPGVHVLNLMGWQGLVALPLLLAGSLLLEPGAFEAARHAPLSAWAWIGYSGLLSTLVGHAGMAWMLQRYPVTTITPLTLPTPFLAVVAATLFYDLPVTWPMIVGGALTLGGVAIIALRSARFRAQ
ncbi:MAG: DMT family transporter [Sphingomonadaceae bacterium]